jgi:hypothetical protein
MIAFFFDFGELASNMSSVTIQNWSVPVGDLAGMI